MAVGRALPLPGGYIKMHSYKPGRSKCAGQPEMECGALADFSFGPDRTAMPAHNPFDRRQTDACPFKFVRIVKALKNAKKLVGVFHVKTSPVVAHERDQVGIDSMRADLDDRLLPGLGVLDRVGQEICKNQFDQPDITLNSRERVDMPLDTSAMSVALELGDDLLQYQ